MSVSISYTKDRRLTISGIQCDCGLNHRLPSQDIFVGSGIVKNTPAYIKKRGLGTRCVLVADQNTFPLAGKALADNLESEGFSVVRCVITRGGVMDPDERACGEVLLSIQPETEFLVAVGSGSIMDTVRVNAMRCKLPFVSVGTAPSMDGYTSVVAPLLLRHVKIHRAGVCPEIIVCDTDILRTAPIAMVCSGVGDVLGKYIAKADWMIGSIINGETYCGVCGEIVTQAIEKLFAHVEAIRDRTGEGIRILTEALLLSGVTIMIVGHTRAVASVEHNIAHYWEMMQLIHGHHPPAHGASVGVATLLAWPMYTRFANEDLSGIDIEAVKLKRITREEREQWMLRAFEAEAAGSIMRDNPEDFLTWDEQLRRIQTAQKRQQDIRNAIALMPPLETILAAMRKLGALTTPAECGIDEKLLNLSMRCAKDYRSRYTLFKLIAECGLEEKYLSDYPLH
ncbi:MAG: sn-glycerol-1-phosphate dehydrogenase [Bacillota bacterium]